MALSGCVTTSTREFLPSRQNPIYRPDQATPVLAEYLRLQCPAFRQTNKPDSGNVRFRVTVDTSGFASRAELTRGSGDKLVDEIFGTVAAQLIFPRDSVRRRSRFETVTMNFRCAGDSASVRVR
ncbi:MAG: hypothetical protein ACT4P7_04595 [Gemmatimonadaceae bacterium]